MGWNGSGVWNRLYSWVTDANNGIPITASRVDADTDDITANGLGNCITRDGQGQPTANLPMNSFQHTGASNPTSTSSYETVQAAQNDLVNWTATASGTSDAITATLSPAPAALADGQFFRVRAAAPNATTTPTIKFNGLGTAGTIKKFGGQALQTSDIAGAGHEIQLKYVSSDNHFELLNPASVPGSPTLATTYAYVYS